MRSGSSGSTRLPGRPEGGTAVNANLTPTTPDVAWRHKHLLDVDVLSLAEIQLVMRTTDAMKEVLARPISKVPALRGTNVTILFYEASTRTRVSFEVAAKNLSADVVNIAASSSSVTKGESLVDTIRTVEALGADMIVMRHGTSGAPYLAAEVFSGSILNGGDGWHAHPSQALLDLYTMRAHLGDESGDFTKGADLTPDAIDRVLAFTVARRATNAQTLTALADIVATSERGLEGVAELRAIDALAKAGGYNESRLLLDPSVVRGLEYYTGPVFEADLTLTARDDKGHPIRFGSIGGGGRYDGLVGRFRAEDVPATGFSIGVSRLFAALKAIGSPIVAGTMHRGPVVVLVMDRDQLPHYQELVSRLRDGGVRAELYLGAAGMKAQMKYADRRSSPCVVIQGSNERELGEVQIKDLIEGAIAGAAIASNEEWKASRPAQASVQEIHMVAAVREILERHGL